MKHRLKSSSCGRRTMPEPAPTAPVIANPRPNVERRKIKERVMFKRINHVEIVTDELDRTLRSYRQMTRRCALAVFAAGSAAISTITYGADLGTRYSTALAAPSQRASAGSRPTPVYPINAPDATPDRSMQRTRIVLGPASGRPTSCGARFAVIGAVLKGVPSEDRHPR